MIYWPYASVLFVVVALALTGDAKMMRTVAAIFANWALGTAFVLATGIYDAWAFSLALDAMTAFAILYHPAGRPQAAIGWAYIAQIIMHAVYAVSDHAIAQHAYWQLLTWIAYLQLALLGGWVGHGWYRYFRHRRNSFRLGQDGRQSLAE